MLDAAPVEQVIVVTGRGIEQDGELAATRSIGRAEIMASASERIEDVLRDVAGLASFRRSNSLSAHPTSQGLTLRGLGGNAASRVALALDGVPQADPFGGWIAFGALDAFAIDRIRVTRGGGIDAVAGTIVLDSRAPDDGVDAALVGGSRRSIDARALAGLKWNEGFASLSGNVARGDGFVPVVVDDRGAADRRAPYRQGAARLRLVHDIGSGTEAQLSLSTYRDRRSRGTAYSDNRQHGTDASVRLVGRGALPWSAVGYVQDRRFDSQFAAVNADRSAATLTLDQRVPARGYGVRIEATPRLGEVETRVGGEWRRVSGETDEKFRFLAGEPTRHREAGGRNVTAGLFAGAGLSGGRWSVAGEGRADHWSMEDGRLVEREISGAPLTDTRFSSRTGWEWSGRIAVGGGLSETLRLRAAATRGWRLPTLNELYRPFRVGADATAANAGLDPERANGIEAGADWTPTKSAKLSATLFANHLEGAIANVSLGTGPGVFPGVGFVAAGGVYRERQNVDAIISRGLEVDGTWSRGPWRGALSYALTDARIDASGAAGALDGKRPAQVARHSGSASFGWDNGKVALNGTARLTGRQFEDDNNDRRLPAALTFDGTARVRMTSLLAAEARVENLFDRQVIAGITGDGTRERALPRTIWVGLTIGSR